MKKNSKLLIIGFGSIGKRHYSNLKMLGFRNIWVYDIALKPKDDSGLNILEKLTPENLRGFQAAFICTPNNLHISYALKCATAKCHLFIEKPLSNSLAKIGQLEKLCRKKRLISMVGCNMRFDGNLQFIKKILEGKKLGKIYSFNHECGYYLPYWRENQDYRKNYAAKKSTGGGIIFDDIHEFDLLFWLNDFASVLESKFIFGKLSDLAIETEDYCIASFKFSNKVIGSVRCDYLQQHRARNLEVIAEKGNLFWDINRSEVRLLAKCSDKIIHRINDFDVNQMYLKELKYFFSCLDKKSPTFNDIKVASRTLKYCIERK